jgi:chromosome segregation ATPase
LQQEKSNSLKNVLSCGTVHSYIKSNLQTKPIKPKNLEIMKKSILNSALALVFLGGIFFACSKPQEDARDKAENAQDQVQESQQDVEDAKIKQDREEYRADKLQKIADNEQRIAELKAKKAEPGKAFDDLRQKRIEDLEKRNAELKAKLNNYQETDQTKWEEFKREFNHDMDDFGKSLEDLGKDNVK